MHEKDVLYTATDPHILEERDARLAIKFDPNENVWIVDEFYDPINIMWRVDIVRADNAGHVLRQRYNYEVETHVVYFRGERPVTMQEMSSLRQSAKVFRKHQQKN